MEPNGLDASLSDDDTLSLWVGRVARAHALLEYDVDNVHGFLARRVGPVPRGTSMKGFDQLVVECRRLLKTSSAESEIQSAGDEALLAARRATASRNRVVHDMWLRDPLQAHSEPPRWNTFQRFGDEQATYQSADLRDLTTVVDAHTLLMRTRMRVSGLYMALHATWPADIETALESSRTDAMKRYIALMTDRFILRANGDFEVF